MKKYRNKYRIESARLKNWDYASNGMYYITIVTKNHNHFFGEIINGKMILNDIGEIAQKFYNEIPIHFPFILLDEMIIMPNHVHGILTIDQMLNRDMKLLNNDNVFTVDGGVDDAVDGRDVACNVSTQHNVPLQHNIPLQRNIPQKNKKMAIISPKTGSISTVIRSYKSVVTKNARIINPDFAWQTRFYDHIIRNEYSLNNIRHYIINNPIKWQGDRNNKE